MSLATFDANSMPLSPGIRLLEASAGTGKTFALAHLVLRLLSEGVQPLAVEQLLVVTFTDAAAAELRDRIARRLQEALQLLEPGSSAEANDAPLAAWLSGLGPTPPPVLRGSLLLLVVLLDNFCTSLLNPIINLVRNWLPLSLAASLLVKHTATAGRRIASLGGLLNIKLVWVARLH